MIQTSYVHFGAQTKLTIQATTPDELSRHITRLSNFGMFPEESLPYDYKPELDNRVIVAATTARVHGALQAMAEVDLSMSPEFCGQFKGRAGGYIKALPDAARARAHEMFASWVKRNDEVLEAGRGAQGTELAVSREEDTAEFRAAKSRLLSAFRR